MIVHVITTSINATDGGMEQAVVSILYNIACMPDVKLYLYTWEMDADAVYQPLPVQCSLINITPAFRALMPPVLKDCSIPNNVEPEERVRMLAMLLGNIIGDVIRNEVDSKQIIISFSVVTSGVLAQRLSEEYDLPHICCVRGSDFSINYFLPHRWPIFSTIAARASWIVTTNREQERRLRKDHNRNDGITTIHNSLFTRGLPRWQPHNRGYVRIVADCGYAIKKGSHLLISAVRELRAESIDVRLALVGPMNPAKHPKADYWNELRKEVSLMDPSGFEFAGVLPVSKMERFLLDGDIYCSASFAEGSSNALNRAMAIGIPMVATDTGSHGEMIKYAAHVRLIAPGDPIELKNALRALVLLSLNNAIEVKDSVVEGWRRDLDPSVARELWLGVLRMVSA